MVMTSAMSVCELPNETVAETTTAPAIRAEATVVPLPPPVREPARKGRTQKLDADGNPILREGALTAEEEHRLSRRWLDHEDRDALERLVRAHLGLVIRIAMEFRHAGPSMEDLIQEGNVGLTIAARRFDPDRDTRLATYATYWIRACMIEHVVRSHGPVRIGTTRSQRKIFFGLGRARRKLEKDGTAADAESLAGALGALERIEAGLDAVGVAGDPSMNTAWQDWLSVRNQALAARLIASSAAARRESRGAHYRRDFPAPSPEPLFTIRVRRGEDGPVITTAPVVMTRATPAGTAAPQTVETGD